MRENIVNTELNQRMFRSTLRKEILDILSKQSEPITAREINKIVYKKYNVNINERKISAQIIYRLDNLIEIINGKPKKYKLKAVLIN